jgi:hypothetical protein
MIKNLPTYYGMISYNIERNKNYFRINLNGNLQTQKVKLYFKNFLNNKTKKVSINDVELNYISEFIEVHQFPAVIKIYH